MTRPRPGGSPLSRGGRALLWLLVPILVILTVWQQASVDRLSLRLAAEQDLMSRVESQVNALRLEADRLSSLGQVEKRASRELGLIRPGTEQIVDLVFSVEEAPGPALALRPWVGEAVAGTREDVLPR